MNKKKNIIKKKSYKRMIILLSIFCLIIIIYIIPRGREIARQSIYSLLPTNPTFIDLPSDPYLNGEKHGKSSSFSIKLLCNLYLKRIICGNNNKIFNRESTKANDLFLLFDDRWQKEIKGLSNGSGVEVKVLMLANSFLDLGVVNIGCRQVVLANKSNLLHAHNLDWNNLGGVGNFLITVFRKKASKSRLATVRLGFPGMIGALTIINEEGISLGFNQLGSSKVVPKMAVFIKMRDIAERCKTFDEANNMLLNFPEGMPFCILMADAKNKKASVYERKLNTIEKRDIVKIKNQKDELEGILTADNIPWCNKNINTSTLYNVAYKIASKEKNIEEMKQILRDNKVLLRCNIYSVIFDYQNNKLYLASGEIPAAQGEYRQFELFKTK